MNTLLFDQCRAYLLAHSLAPIGATDRQVLRAVTISRETGAGAITVGQLAMDLLEARLAGDVRYPWAAFDRELVKRVLEEHRLPETVEPYLVEDVPPRMNDAVEELLGVHPSTRTLVEHTNDTILKLAQSGNVILIGRGAHLVTAHLDHVLHVRLVAPLEFRIHHIQEYYRLSRQDAVAYIRKEDRAKARYGRRHFKTRFQSPLQYHLTINTGFMSFSEAARLICDAVINMPNNSRPACSRGCHSCGGGQPNLEGEHSRCRSLIPG